jgi:predicted aspartyl protease
MLRGRFGDTTTTPFIEASIHLPRFGISGYVSFLADTGATGTVLMPMDSRRLGVNFSQLRYPKISRTAGGPARGDMETGVLGFWDRGTNKIFGFNLEIQIFEPTRDNTTLPSLLGRDVLNRWRIVIDFSRGAFECTPTSWDHRLNVT